MPASEKQSGHSQRNEVAGDHVASFQDSLLSYHPMTFYLNQQVQTRTQLTQESPASISNPGAASLRRVTSALPTSDLTFSMAKKWGEGLGKQLKVKVSRVRAEFQVPRTHINAG